MHVFNDFCYNVMQLSDPQPQLTNRKAPKDLKEENSIMTECSIVFLLYCDNVMDVFCLVVGELLWAKLEYTGQSQ